VYGSWIINPQEVRESELRRLDDLLDPRWRGRISTDDPAGAGLGLAAATYLYLHKGEDYFRKLYVEQAPRPSRDDRQLEDWLVGGTQPITLGLAPKNAAQLAAQGLPVKDIGLLDGPGFVRGPLVALLANAPHPNASKLFLNWIASPAGLRVHAQAERLPPLRTDVDHPWIDGYQVPSPDVVYPYNADDFAFIAERKAAVLQRIRDLLR
jgi:iron(III) transport system substrate-binding protein